MSVVRALDPVTGLPVRVYRFAGEPVAGADQLRHPHVYRVLEAGSDGDEGYLVAHLVDGTDDLQRRPGLLDDDTAVAATAALAEAARLGVVHGDLGPRRVHRRGEDVYLEGYGVPWSDARLDDDVRRLADGLCELDGHTLSNDVRVALEAGAAGMAGGAEALAERVAVAAAAARRAPPPRPDTAPAAVRAPDAAFSGVVLDVDDPPEPDALVVDTDPGVAATDAASATAAHEPQRAAPAAAPAAPRAARPPIHRRDDDVRGDVTDDVADPDMGTGGGAERATPAPPTRDSGSFRKRPPPDVTYRTGETPPPSARTSGTSTRVPREERTQRRRTWLLAALVVLAVVLAVVTALARRPVPPPPATGPLSSFVVEVRIEPASLPPASLVVIASPPASRLSPGSVLGTVPRRVVFDAEGTWQVEGRFQDRRSEIVTFRLPQDRDVVLRFAESP